MNPPPLRYPPSPVLEHRWRIVCYAASAAAGLLALASLAAGEVAASPLGWSWLGAATSIAVLLLAIMAILTAHRRASAQALATLVLLWAVAASCLRLRAAAAHWEAALAPALVLAALLALAQLQPQAQRWLASLLTLAVLVCAAVALLDAGVGLRWTPLGAGTAVLAPAAAGALLLLSLAWMAAAPRLRPISLVHEPGSTGWLMRRLVPVVIVFPVLLAWLHSLNPNSRSLTPWFGAVIFVVLSFLIFLTLLWKAAGALDRLDVNRDELRAYAHEVSDLYDHAPCGYHSLDAEGRIVRVNDTELSWLGYRRAEVAGKMVFADLLTPASRVAFLRHFEKVREAGAVSDLELELVRKDGTLLPALVSASAITDNHGRFLRTRSTLFDISQRKQAEAALRMSEARNRAILASAADAIVTLEENGAIADFNPAAELMFGIRRSVAVEMMGVDLLAPGSALRRRALASLDVEADDAANRHLEFQARRAGGTTFPAELTLTRVAGQAPGLFTAFIRDLTERKRAEAELRASEERLRLLLDSTGEGIYALDLAGNCILCNPAALRMLGYQHAEELLGRPIHNLIHHTRADGHPYPAHECRSFLAARQGIGIEVDDELFFRKDGSGFPVEYRSYPVERNHQPVGLVVTFTDITARCQMETQMRQSQKMEAIGRLAAGIAHDFNNLLTVINGYSDLLLESSADADTRDKLRSVRAAGDRAATLTHQLLAFSRQQVLQPRMLDLNAVVRDLEPLLRRSIGEDIELSCVLGPDLPPVKADPSQLDQVLMNLVVNARDAMPNGGRLRIETASATLDAASVRPHAGLAPGAYVLLSVSDSGMGMQPEVQSHIFEPFFTTKPLGKGTGLGLPTVFGIARQSGGTVVVNSMWGKGTTMQVYLPIFSHSGTAAHGPTPVRLAAAAAVPAAEPEPEAGGEAILVVEDEPELRHFMVEVLEDSGFEVLEAGRPDWAQELSRTHVQPIRLLITDVVMPSMSGPVLAELLLRQRRGLRVLYITGYADPAAAPSPFLKNPFTPEALVQAVHSALDSEPNSAAAPAARAG